MSKSYLQDESYILKKINAAISNSIYIFDLTENIIVWLNEQGQELYGYSISEIRAMGENYFATVMHPEDVPRLIQAVEDVKTLKDDDVYTLEYRFKSKNGQYNWVADRVTIFSRNSQGQVLSVLGVTSSIDERKKNESRLKESLEKLNLSLSAAKMGTWEWDISANSLVWDKRMYLIHDGQESRELSPMQIVVNSVDPEDLEPLRQRVADAVKSEQDFYVSYRMTYKNSEVHHISVYGKYQASAEFPKMYGVAWDSTLEVQTVQEIAEAKALLISSTKMAALGEMSGGIAHEINNPLTVIQARSYQLGQMVESGKVELEKVKHIGESIGRTAEKIAKIIKSLRAFAREGSYDPFEVVSVKKIVEETLEFCRTRFYNHGVEIETIPFDEDLEVECRIIQIQQVLLNLLNNSFDAIQESPTRWIRVDVKDRDHSLEIAVTDSGEGVPKDILEQIMLPFFTTKEAGKGTGLGLSISSGIIRSHQGTLTLDANSEYTRFVITLPKLQNSSELLVY